SAVLICGVSRRGRGRKRAGPTGDRATVQPHASARAETNTPNQPAPPPTLATAPQRSLHWSARNTATDRFRHKKAQKAYKQKRTETSCYWISFCNFCAWLWLLIHFEHGQEGFLRNLDAPNFLHPLLAFFLLLEQLSFARDVAAVTLRNHVLAQSLHRLARN